MDRGGQNSDIIVREGSGIWLGGMTRVGSCWGRWGVSIPLFVLFWCSFGALFVFRCSFRFVLFLFFLVVVSVLFLLLFFCFIFWCSFWFSCSILLLFSGVHFVSFLFCSGGSLIPICFFLHYFALLLCVYLIQCSSYPRVCSNVCSVLFILPPCPFIRCVFCAFFVRF